MRHLLIALVVCMLAACGSDAEEPTTSPEEGAETSGEESPPVEDPPLPMAGAERPEMTVEECEGQGATVVGDIGDGAIHRPDYLCPSGVEPIGRIALGIEGSVCCP